MAKAITPDELELDLDFDFDFNFDYNFKKGMRTVKKVKKDIIERQSLFEIKDPVSALSHFIGFVAALIGMPILLIKASMDGQNLTAMVSLSIFMLSMILLYGASTAYHTFKVMPDTGKRLKKMDHMMIFVLIAGSYTPMCTIVLEGKAGLHLLVLIWGIAALGILFKAFWVTCPRWVSSVIYITMGWAALLAIDQIFHSMELAGFILLVAGGILYSMGGIIYALKIREIVPGFGAHEVFHLFVLAGSLCHYFMMMIYVA